MLKQLVIRHYLLVKDVELDFTSGLTAFTGETGAGKSMVLGALDVLLGEKFPRDAVGDDSERAVIEGVFQFPDTSRFREFIAEDDGEATAEIIVRREIGRQGRTRSWLNDRPIPLDDLLKLRELLADFHGQREHQTLFKPAKQLEYLDLYAGTLRGRERVNLLYGKRQNQRRELTETEQRLAAHQKERALLEYQLEEIERLGLSPGEEATLEARLHKLESAEKLAAETGRLIDLLEENEPSLVGASGVAKNIAANLAKIDADAEPMAKELADIGSQLKDIALQARHYLDSLAFDEAELQTLRERRGLLWELRRKHGVTLDQLLARAAEMKALLAEGETLEQTRARLAQELHETDKALADAATELSQKRQRAATAFSAQVVTALKPLGFEDPRFLVAAMPLPSPLTPDLIGADGADKIEFLFAANPGGKPASLSAVASGGESSRVTLAIKSVLSDQAEYPLLVYDEIDLGISGRVADQVGKALAAIARRHQVLVITHLPQIASRADQQISVKKATRGTTTTVTAAALQDDERVREIAALIAGSRITDQALASASELLKDGGKRKH
jgi:DNA repair protein RecN (Recombination protein N)